jgi:hypothetical protein
MDDTEQISKWIEWETKNKDYLYDNSKISITGNIKWANII